MFKRFSTKKVASSLSCCCCCSKSGLINTEHQEMRLV